MVKKLSALVELTLVIQDLVKTLKSDVGAGEFGLWVCGNKAYLQRTASGEIEIVEVEMAVYVGFGLQHYVAKVALRLQLNHKCTFFHVMAEVVSGIGQV